MITDATMDTPQGEEPIFEPLQRARSNTWPLPKPENLEENNGVASPVKCETMDSAVTPEAGSCGARNVGVSPMGLALHCGQVKKNSSRRNAWGNLSYADLITRAIQSAPDNRLTLSQIYEWMVHNVPYFKDKGDNNSSAGWKNSIRHNLSLHNRFIRVQNEGTGKSSWWMLNPDAKPGKSARRRATSMETSKFEKRRGRVKKKVDALRSGLDVNPSPTSSISETLDVFSDSPPLRGFQLSPDFRTRASSNASSCSRLSPIPSAEHEWTMTYGSYLQPEQLAGNLEQTMKLSHVDSFLYTPTSTPYESQLSNVYQTPFGHHVSDMSTLRLPDSSGRMSPLIHDSSNSQNLFDDLNINIETLPGEFECNVDEVIKHELSIEGTLDFNFSHSPIQSSNTSPTQPTSQSSFNGNSWVH